jgi:hypothetical protein
MKPDLIDCRRFYLQNMSDVIFCLMRRFRIQYPAETVGSFRRFQLFFCARVRQYHEYHWHSSSSSSRALQSVVDFGFQYNFPPFLTVLIRPVGISVVSSSQQICFYGIGMSTQCLTPSLEDQGVSLSLEPHS